MKTFEEVKEILSGVQYKKDWVLTLHRSMASMYMQSLMSVCAELEVRG